MQSTSVFINLQSWGFVDCIDLSKVSITPLSILRSDSYRNRSE